ncbi:prepilin peptidase [Reyranella sp.]|uniref:prepilin peptidase n=1 Tax=Reyranella sp. TaxID=1929291 RepID=UPI003D135A91
MSPVAVLQVACLALLTVLLVAAAVQDVRTLQIDNGFPLAIVGLFAVSAAAGLVSGRLPASAIGLAVAGGALVFAAGAAAFAVGALGGGDVKLLAAVSLFAGSGRLLDFLAITVLVGGGLGIAVVAGVPSGRSAATGTVPLKARLHGDLPLGPAIAAGGLWVALSAGSG